MDQSQHQTKHRGNDYEKGDNRMIEDTLKKSNEIVKKIK